MINADIGVTTGYGRDPDSATVLPEGELVHPGIDLDAERRGRFFGIVDSASRFEISDDVGYGLREYMFLGRFPEYGLTGILNGTP